MAEEGAIDPWQRVTDVATRLSAVSRENRYDAYEVFDWPPSLPDDQYWMSPELMTCYGTALWDELDEQQRVALSRYEAINFFSVNVHLIRELIGGVADRIYTTWHPGLSEFFHDFIAEENIHAWFFATFCKRYGGKIYPIRRVAPDTSSTDGVLRDIAVFGRVLIAEELCDFFNVAMADDDRLPPICQQINRVHHQDEARHIAFGRQLMRALRDEATERVSAEKLTEVGEYLARYITFCVRALYNRDMYADAALPDPAGVRKRLLQDPRRTEMHQRAVGRTVAFFDRIGIVGGDSVRL
ncbi:diiron oxygenase [Micromonospora sp. NPDC005652]|uniref:diiron oxygenase n=1 Tax=Micromonospora sp. NPDC005652 TaxID=3157046 RepID=UPI0033D68A90